MEVGNADWVFNHFFREIIRYPVRAMVFESASCENHGERGALMTATAATVELGWTTELGGDDDERFFEETMIFQILDEGCESVVEFADEGVLVIDALVVNIPACAVDEVEVVGHFDESNTALDETPCEQAALSELSSVGRTYG